MTCLCCALDLGFHRKSLLRKSVYQDKHTMLLKLVKNMNWPIFLSLTAIFQNNEETNLMLKNISDFEEGLMRILGSSTDN